jgi:hypothetical protein
VPQSRPRVEWQSGFSGIRIVAYVQVTGGALYIKMLILILATVLTLLRCGEIRASRHHTERHCKHSAKHDGSEHGFLPKII